MYRYIGRYLYVPTYIKPFLFAQSREAADLGWLVVSIEPHFINLIMYEPLYVNLFFSTLDRKPYFKSHIFQVLIEIG